MFYYATFGLLQVEMEGSFKKSHISYMHMHKQDTFGFNVKNQNNSFESQSRTFSVLRNSHTPIYQQNIFSEQ